MSEFVSPNRGALVAVARLLAPDYALDGALPDARLVPGLVSEVRSRFTALAGLMLP